MKSWKHSSATTYDFQIDKKKNIIIKLVQIVHTDLLWPKVYSTGLQYDFTETTKETGISE